MEGKRQHDLGLMIIDDSAAGGAERRERSR